MSRRAGAVESDPPTTLPSRRVERSMGETFGAALALMRGPDPRPEVRRFASRFFWHRLYAVLRFSERLVFFR